ncbi:uncharacterized protein LOC124311917 isoform X2 [Daphnia pulicaria]|uniref:uncharacterized protein LOC124311917 isoform X2 n=1 Tax=Daphnia pulicaria TaxID=35523 RepID=UPI001EECDCF2|nr:uncharacterized protein LOC124311917 isoform X2 [Daphnia pulicaria]
MGCFDCGMTKLVTCCVVGRGNRYNVRVKDISFFHYPKVKVSGHPEHVVSKRRRLEWLKRTNLREKDVTQYSRVCSEHFVSGKPSYRWLTPDVDWAPSLNLEKNSIGLASVERTNRSIRRHNARICPTMTEDETDIQQVSVTTVSEDTAVIEGEMQNTSGELIYDLTNYHNLSTNTPDLAFENQSLVLRVKELEHEKQLLVEAVSRLQEEIDKKICDVILADRGFLVEE